MLIEKNDLGELIKHVKFFDENKFDTVMYLKDQINKPSDLRFTDSEFDKDVFRATTPNADRYSSVGTKDLLDTLVAVGKKEAVTLELPFVEKTSRLFNLNDAFDEHRRTRELQVLREIPGNHDSHEMGLLHENQIKRGRH